MWSTFFAKSMLQHGELISPVSEHYNNPTFMKWDLTSWGIPGMNKILVFHDLSYLIYDGKRRHPNFAGRLRSEYAQKRIGLLSLPISMN